MKVKFRIWKDDVCALHRALLLPQQLRCSRGLVVDSEEALCVFEVTGVSMSVWGHGRQIC